MKIPVLAGGATVLALLLTACAVGQGAGVSAPVSAGEAAQQDTAVYATRKADVPGATPDARPLGQHWYAFRFEAAAQVLELPVDAATRAKLGWKPRGDSEYTLQSGQCADMVFAAPGGEILARMANTGKEAAKVEDCPMVGVLASAADGNAAAEVRLPGGIAVGSPVEDVLAAYGAPDDGTPQPDGTLQYSVSRTATLALATAGGRVCGIELLRFEAPVLPARNTLPPEVLAYRTPDELGGDVWSYNMRYGGALYSLPAPVSAFAANGWVLPDTGTVPPGGFVRGVTLSLGNVRLRTCLYNLTDSEQPLAACFVGMVESSASSVPLPLELPGGVTDASSYDEAVALLGPPHETYTTINTFSATWNGPNGYLVLRYTPKEMEPFAVEAWRTQAAGF